MMTNEKMEIVGVIVNKLPNGCPDCDFRHKFVSTLSGEDLMMCRITEKIIAEEHIHETKDEFFWIYCYGDTCPSWCPLITKHQYTDELFEEFDKSLTLKPKERYTIMDVKFKEREE
jgi:hypothetical protein